jgi:hypothetical protein
MIGIYGRIVLAACCFILPIKGEEGTAVKTNVEFLADLVNREIKGDIEQSALNHIRRIQADTVYLHGLQTHPGNWLVEQALLTSLGGQNLAVVLEAKVPGQDQPPDTAAAGQPDTSRTDTSAVATAEDSTALAAPERDDSYPAGSKKALLEYRVVECFITYQKIGRVGIIGKKQIERHGKVAGLVRLMEPASQVVLWTKQFSQTQSDTIPYHAKDLVENSHYSFLKGGPVRPYWKELLEITLAGGSVGYLLYLFFSQSFN